MLGPFLLGATILGVISDVHHVGIAVRDMEKACALFRDALLLPVVKDGLAPARGARVMMIEVGSTSSNTLFRSICEARHHDLCLRNLCGCERRP